MRWQTKVHLSLKLGKLKYSVFVTLSVESKKKECDYDI